MDHGLGKMGTADDVPTGNFRHLGKGKLDSFAAEEGKQTLASLVPPRFHPVAKILQYGRVRGETVA